MTTETSEEGLGEAAHDELRATEKQRWALYRWGVERERAEDPGSRAARSRSGRVRKGDRNA